MRIVYGLLSIYCLVHLTFIIFSFKAYGNELYVWAILAWSFASFMSMRGYWKSDAPYRKKRKEWHTNPNNWSV